MHYSKIQKFLSSFLIFAFLFSLAFRVPFYDYDTYAGNSDYYDIVSIIVDTNTYAEIKDELNRYAKDIQGVLENTKVVILPTPSNTSAFNIASLNESLYYEGYKLIADVDFESRLVGTVIVGDFNLPIVFNKNESSKTILPFTDFEDKVYVYNNESKRYEKNSENIDGLKSEIWHGVISPNLGSFSKNIDGLKDYFDKNNDFYSGTGNFKFSEGILNGNKNVGVSSKYDPFIFYYDQFREEKGLNYNSFQGYEGYLENKEDIVYNRFNKELADKLSEKVLNLGNKKLGKLLKKVDPKNSLKFNTNKPNTDKVPDIQTRFIIENVTKKFLEVFSKGSISEFRTNVHNAGRYNIDGTGVNADMIPYLISVLDSVNDEVIKDVNNELERIIDNKVINELSSKIIIPTSFNNEQFTSGGGDSDSSDDSGDNSSSDSSRKSTGGDEYINFLYGKNANDITSAAGCSIYLGSTTNSGQLVEANRGLNIRNTESDFNMLKALGIGKCSTMKGTKGYWGGNSPINLNIDSAQVGVLELSTRDLNGSIKPLFDIQGSKQIFDYTKTPNPLNCLSTNFLLVKSFGEDDDTSYKIPSNPEGWNCETKNIQFDLGLEKKGTEYNYALKQDCTDVFLDGNIVSSSFDDLECTSIDTFYFKTIDSYITHKSPTPYELTEEIKGMTTPNLPIDKDRYIDFLGKYGEYKKIYYPYLFRLGVKTGDELTINNIKKSLKNYLTLTTIDLYGELSNKSDDTLTIAGESKTLSYLDTLTFALYWNNLNSVSAKYAFIFDNYLIDQFDDSDKNYYLPKNKKQYEIAYLGVEGDAQNMYIKMDPEGKADNPYASIISNNIKLSSQMLGSNIGSGLDEEGIFKCAPPDGVPIWEWIPAVMCWLKEMLPPTISLSKGMYGESLFSSEDDDDVALYNKGDVDKNGINDGLEKKLGDNGDVILTSDSEKYYYNKNAKLKATIKDKNGKIVKIDSNSYINFELIKIEAIKDESKEFTNSNKKIVFDIDDANNDESIISDYVTFKNYKIRAQGGIVDYGIGLKSKDANIYIRSYISTDDISGNESIYIESEPLIIKIRGDRLFTSTYKIENNEDKYETFSGINSLKVSDKTNIFLVDGTNKNISDVSRLINTSGISKEKLILFIENISTNNIDVDINYPIVVSLLQSDEILKKITINKGELSLFKSLFSLKKSGSYTIEIVDNDGLKTSKNIELLPGIANSIDTKLGTTIMQSGGNISTNFITVYDKYLNIVSGEFYDINFEIDGESVKFLNNDSNKLSTTIFEGYKVFRLKSSSKEGNSLLNIAVIDNEGIEVSSTAKDIKVLDDINFVAKPLSNNIKVGGGAYKYEISLRNTDGSILTDFNSRAYLIADSIYLKSTKPYVNLVNGIAEIEFKTKTLAGENIQIEFQVEGLNKIVKKEITILPDSPMKIDLVLSKSKIEASQIAYSNLVVELKDRYNNLVFNDDSTNTSLEILDKYFSVLTSDKKTSKVKGGKTEYKFYGTTTPGIAYFKIGTNPSLNINSFTINDAGGNIVIKGVGENVGKIETFYFWNKLKLKGKKYNSLYTTLIGSNYGDINEKNYLAGSLLFEKNNRALAVTSLLNTSYKRSNILNLSENGGLLPMYSADDLSQDIDITPIIINDKLSLSIYNKALNIFVGKIFYNFKSDTKLVACDGKINDCIDKDKTSILLKSNSDKYNVYLDGGKLILRNNNGKNLLEILGDGKINRFGSINFEVDENNYGNNLLINIKSGSNIIAKMGYNFKNSITSISRDENIFKSKISNIKNSILVLLKTNSYSAYQSGNKNNKSKIFYYNDPFTTEYTLNSFTKNSFDGLENFPKKEGIGWKNGNKSLLAFSAGKTVGESVKDYMSFSVINLGDPVISIKKIKKKLPGSNLSRKFDKTIGKLLSNNDEILGYRVFDYDNDSKADILLIKYDNNLELLENKQINSNLIKKGNLANIVDLGSVDFIETGDFTGDGYDDIFFADKNGKPYLLNNTNKNFNRYSLVKNFNLTGNIIRAESFDMDNDGITDIVILDGSGEVNIFYGGGTANKPNFTKKLISENNGIKFNSTARSDNSVVYFDGLYQPGDSSVDNKKIDGFLFVNYPYNNEIIKDSYKNLPQGKSNKYFLKSEYSEYSGIKVKKIFIDKNKGFVNSGDIVKAEIVLTNVGNKKINNIAFGEIVSKILKLDNTSINSDKDFYIQNGNQGYDFLVDGFSLDIGETITFNYEAKVRPIKYGFLEVGLFEKGEIGDDKFGDIIIKKDNKNCSKPVGIFRSLAENGSRSYSEGTKIPICNEEKIKLPPEIEKNNVDKDLNGIPDYIDELTNPKDRTAIKKYSNEQLDKMYSDSDYDGIPDNEDNFNMDGSITFDLGGIGKNVDKGLDKVQEIFNSFNCSNSSCFASPLNWAPLAPGSDPVFMGKPIGDGLNVGEGIPIFSGLTWLPVSGVCVPSVWPVSPLGVGCSGLGAGGILGTLSPTNFFRLFVTPTITGGVGTAACFGSPAIVAGNAPYKGFSPLIPGGNCVVAATTALTCNDEYIGDPSSIGNPIYSGDGSFGIINGNCSSGDKPEQLLQKKAVSTYLRNSGNGKVSDVFDFLPGDFSETPEGPLFTDGGGGDVSVKLDLESFESGNFSDIIKIQQKRITPFPSWMMDWVTRQIEEIVNKLTDFPTIFIILPDFTGIFDGNWGDFSGNNNRVDSKVIDIDPNLTGNETIDGNVKKVNSGIKEAYEFIASTPLVKINQETVNITLPWISQAELNKIIVSRKTTLAQWKGEINRAQNKWKNLSYSDQRGVTIRNDLNSTINRLEQNLQIIESYKTIPEDISKLLTTKEQYLEQILWNINSISNMLGGRIGKNGKRFKAWVETYILIKSILKSWQLLIDVFTDYEDECKGCKNERQDALEQEFSLIDLIVPKIPVIRFPKWPDIIIDLHNIRAGLTIMLPEYDINSKPILLPTLPNLYLPDIPSLNLNLNLPDFPLLPTINIPGLPNIPSLPVIILPDLPPPPKLPEMLGSIEVVLDIMKLILKAMCILKSSPIVPEWRAGDQISFLTERNGYLLSDFFEISLPDFSFPFVDAIEVTSFVNLEFETDFIVELARQIALPLNSFSNDFTNIFNIQTTDVDFRNVLPNTINIDTDVSEDGVDTNISIVDYNGNYVDNIGFKKIINKALSSKSITSDPKMENIRKLWKQVNNMTYSKENALIKELQNNNKEKFEALTDIVNTEIIKNKELKKKFKNFGESAIITKVAFDNQNNINVYNNRLEKYNNKFFKTAKKLVNPSTIMSKDLEKSGKELINSLDTKLTSYSKGSSINNLGKNDILSANVSGNSKLTASSNNISSNADTQNACQVQSEAQSTGKNGYKYEGLYVVEGNVSYRLFDYLDELNGNEVTKIVDMDNDGDEDLLYFVNNQLFLKENLKIKPTKNYVTTNPIILNENDNKFFNGDIFYEAVNGAYEIGNDNGNINLGFIASSNNSVRNFRVGLYTIVDKYLNENTDNYTPKLIKKDIIDAISGIKNITQIDENEMYITRKNISYIKNVGKLKGAKLTTKELIDIKDNLALDQVVNILKGTTLYSGSNQFSIEYIINNNSEKILSLNVSKYQNIELLKDIKIIGITGNAYIKGDNNVIYEGVNIRNYLDKPLFPGTKIEYLGSNEKGYIELMYYDSSEYSIDFSSINSWELYDLGYESNNYFIRVKKKNDNYYAKINSFKENIEGTLSNQILLSPQIEADQVAPELTMPSIKIPVYQKQMIDLTDYIYENGGIKNIDRVIVDMDLKTDTNANGNLKDDNDGSISGLYEDKVKLLLSLSSLKLEFGPFDNLFVKDIGITLIDKNGNKGYKEVSLEIYSPIPKISEYDNGLIKGSINEKLTKEPIDLYKFRGGIITKLENNKGLQNALTDSGNYSFDVNKSGPKGLKLYNGTDAIVNINENTGKITLIDTNLTTKVLSSSNKENDSVFPKILVQDKLADIFYQYVRVNDVNKVKYVDTFEGLSEKGIYFNFSDTTNYNYYILPETLDFNPGSLSIYRNSNTNKEELITIFNDGRINTINDFYKLKYDTYGDYIVFKIIDSNFNREIGKILFIVDSEYIME